MFYHFVVQVNEALCTVFGSTKEEFSIRSILQLETNKQSLKHLIEKLLTGELQAFNLNAVGMHKDGYTIPLNIRMTAVSFASFCYSEFSPPCLGFCCCFCRWWEGARGISISLATS